MFTAIFKQRKSKNVLNANEKMKRLEIIEKVQQVEAEEKKEEEVEEEFKVQWVWVNIIGVIVLHYWIYSFTLLAHPWDYGNSI